MRQEAALVTLALGQLLWSGPALAADELPGKLLDLEGAAESVAVDPSGSWFVTGGRDGTVRLWSLKADDPFAKRAFVLRGHSQPVRQLMVSPDGRRLATCSPDVMLRLWDLAAKDPGAASHLLSPAAAKDSPKEPVGWLLEMSGNSRWLLARSGAEPSRTRLWDLRAEEPGSKVVVLEASATLGFCANRRWLVGSRQDAERAQVWDLNSDDPLAKSVEFQVPGKAALEVLSPDGRWLFARHRDAADKSKDQFLKLAPLP
jgi:WD40 repeat protein